MDITSISELTTAFDDPIVIEDVDRVQLREAPLKERTVISGIKMESLVLENVTAREGLHLRHCEIKYLRVMDAYLVGGLTIEDCEFGTVDLRSIKSRASIALTRVRLRELNCHAITRMTLNDLSSETTVRLDSIEERLDVHRLRCIALAVENDSLVPDVEYIRLSRISTANEIELTDINAHSLTAQRLDCHDLIVRRPCIIALSLEDLRVRRLASIVDPSGREGAKTVISGQCANLNITGPISRADNEIRVRLSMLVEHDLKLAGRTNVELTDCHIGGVLERVHQGDADHSRFTLDQNTHVARVAVSARRLRTVRGARSFCRTLLGRDGVRELRLLHRSLTERPVEQDIVYFALRQAEAGEFGRILRLIYRTRGLLFGWGVLLWPPIRSLLLGILISGIGIYAQRQLVQHEGWLDLADLAWSMALSATFWFNVGVGTPNQLTGTGWATVAVSMAACGIVLVTVIIGVAIRRLVR